MITADELEFLLSQIEELEATIQEQAEQIDFLMRERAVLRGGAKALSDECGPSLGVITGVAPPGYTYGSAGQLVITDRQAIYERLRKL